MKDTVEAIIHYPNGAGSSRLTILNDRTGTAARGNYQCTFFQTIPGEPERQLGSFPLEGIRRWFGVEYLVSLALEMIVAASKDDPPVHDTITGGPYTESDVPMATVEEEIEAFQKIIGLAQDHLRSLTGLTGDAHHSVSVTAAPGTGGAA